MVVFVWLQNAKMYVFFTKKVKVIILIQISSH